MAPSLSDPLPDVSSEAPAADRPAESDAARMGVEPDGKTSAIRPVVSRRRKFAQKVRVWFGRVAR
jgi:hypothetical protein